MKFTAVIAFCLATFVTSLFADQPNVLIIYGDDQGSIDLGCFGVEDLKTSHLDGLAEQGLKLTQMYSAAPVCSASRVGLLTGRYPARAGQPGNGDLKSEEVTVAEVFQAAGYRTGHVGKWHLGKTSDKDPAGQGFDDWFGHLGGCIDNYSHFFYWNGPNRHDLFESGQEIYRPGDFFPKLMADRCKQFINQPSDEPWLLYWAFNAPHYPYQGTPEWLDYYQDLPTPRREYCAFVSTMDDYIGSVIDHLDAAGLAENTIVIYQPDHGHSTETRAFGGGGNSGPYRGAKFSLFEGGIRVPSIVRFPKNFSAGESRGQFVTSCDWLPTLCELCDVTPPDTKLDGVSLVDVLTKNADAPREQFYWQMGSGAKAQWAVRDGDWKLIANPKDTTAAQDRQINGGKLVAKWFLANLKADPSEQINLAERQPAIKQRLIELKEGWTSDFP